MDACIALENLCKRYGRTTAVDHLTFSVRPGEVMGLLGPNGAGKSTTIGMLTGLVRPGSGRIAVFGLDMHHHAMEIRRRMGVLVERPTFPEYLTVRRVLRLHALLAGAPSSAAETALARTGLSPLAASRVGALSQGMRQRLGIAQAILAEPELLILDEPTTGLDVEGTRESLQFLRQLAVEAGVTILFSSHQMGEVEQLCDRIAIMNQGRLVACEAKESLLSWDLSHVQLLVDRPDAAAGLLRQQPWVSSATVATDGVMVAMNGPAAHEIAPCLTAQGFQLSGIVPRRRTLEDYFIEVTRP